MRRTQQEVANASSTICEEVKSPHSYVDLDQQGRAWGQFLSTGTRQHGVYGTSAAVQILTLAGEDESSDHIKLAREWLVSEFEDQGSKSNKRGVFGIVYKMSYFLDALATSQNLITDGEFARYFEILLHRTVQDRWGDYRHDGIRDPNQNIVATCSALLSLSRYAPFLGSSDCQKILKRFRQDVQDQQVQIDIAKLALSILTLAKYSARFRSFAKDTECAKELDQSLPEYCVLLQEKLSDKDHRLGEWVPYHFKCSTPVGDDYTDYMYFPIDAISALSLIEAGHLRGNMDYVLKVVRHYLDNVTKNEGFLTPYQMKATVDNLWVMRLFDGFKHIDVKSLRFFDLHPIRLAWLRPRLGRVLLIAALVSVTLVLAWISSSNFDPSWRAFSTVFVALLSSAVSRMVFREQSKT